MSAISPADPRTPGLLGELVHKIKLDAPRDATHKLAMLVGSGIAEWTWWDVGGQDFLASCAAQQRRVYREWGLSAARARARTTLATLALLIARGRGCRRRSSDSLARASGLITGLE